MGDVENGNEPNSTSEGFILIDPLLYGMGIPRCTGSTSPEKNPPA
jgi:hypothetical protein